MVPCSRICKDDQLPHSVHWGIKPLLKNSTPYFSPSLLLNLQTTQVPLFRQSLQYTGFSLPVPRPPLKI